MADENEQQSACEAGRDEQHCKCRQRRAAAEAAAANASAAQQPAAHHCTCKHDGAAEAGDEQPKHCACKHDAEGHAISTEPHLGYVADLASLIEIQPESTVSRVVMREDGLRVVLFGFDKDQALSEHTAAMPVTIQVLEGKLRVGGEGREVERTRRRRLPERPPAAHRLRRRTQQDAPVDVRQPRLRIIRATCIVA